jgi:prolyl oligopeptidase
MPKLMESPPHTPVEAVTETLHGVSVTDPYRWLEDQNSPRTREWLAAQTLYARSHFDAIAGRERIRRRVRELLDVELCDSLQKVGTRYFFRKRVPGQEQPGIFCRDGIDGKDQLLIDPAEQGTGIYTAVKPLRVSPDGRLLLYEVKQGGERSGTFELLEIATKTVLPDALPRGYLRGFAFTPDSSAFYYTHEPADDETFKGRAVYLHSLGTESKEDREVFRADETNHVRLQIVPGQHHIGILVFHFRDSTYTDFYVVALGGDHAPEVVIQGAQHKFGPVILKSGRILAITDLDAPNYKIIESHKTTTGQLEFVELVSPADSPIQYWIATEQRIFVSYLRKLRTEIEVFDAWGNRIDRILGDESETVRVIGASQAGDELFLERESFTQPVRVETYSADQPNLRLWAQRDISLNSQDFAHVQVRFQGKDGTRIPMYLVGRREILGGGPQPTIMTSYGGFGVSMTPQFSVFVALMMERGCLFALPNIRGGSEFGLDWHNAARRRNRQVAFDDFLSAADWLIASGHSAPERLAIFGGSNSGLLVGAAMTQRPELFRAVVCMAPVLDMLRYHLFDGAQVWKEEFGTAEDPADFAALFDYSPYHRVRDGVGYPATLIVSGGCDQNCNAMHARKMTARLQAANTSDQPILLEYDPHRGHSPVLPFSHRVEAVTDRVAFLCDQLQLVD